MKDYLKKNRPRICLLLISFFFISNMLTLFYDGLYKAVLLYPQDINDALKLYKLLTYPLFVGGLSRWLHSALVIIVAGYIVENRLSKKKVVTLIALSSILGGLIFSVININDPVNTPIASPTMITWGISSCAFILILKRIRTSTLFEKLVAGAFIVSLLTIQFIDYGFFLGQMGVIVLGLLYGFIFDKEKLPITQVLRQAG